MAELTRELSERATGRRIARVLGMTEAQADAAGIDPIWKVDGRNGRSHWAIEVEALTQAGVVGLVRDALDQLLPEPLADVLEREAAERDGVASALEHEGDEHE